MGSGFLGDVPVIGCFVVLVIVCMLIGAGIMSVVWWLT